MLKQLIDRDPIDYLKLLLIALFVLAVAVVSIAVAEFLLPPGIMAEGIALIALVAAAPAVLVGGLAFLLMILARMRTIFRNENDD